ncbi:MAG: PAC2 family protein [Dehalococcoidia bacterium]
MNNIIKHLEPQIRPSTLIVAFAGWPDASQAATDAINFLIQGLPALKFAEIDPEEFFVFSEERPEVRIGQNNERVILWPENDFYCHSFQQKDRNIILLNGTEPNIKWKKFISLVFQIVSEQKVDKIISVGSLLDAVPHTRPLRISGSSTSTQEAKKIEWSGVRKSKYQGPTSIHSLFVDACKSEDIIHTSLWVHCSHYVNSNTNPRAAYTLLKNLKEICEIQIDLSELKISAERFDVQMDKAIEDDPEISSYVSQLEENYDSSSVSLDEIPNHESVVEELEDFLRSQSPGNS